MKPYTSANTEPNFYCLLSASKKQQLLSALLNDDCFNSAKFSDRYQLLSDEQRRHFTKCWYDLMLPITDHKLTGDPKGQTIELSATHIRNQPLSEAQEYALTAWLIELFNSLFIKQNVKLVRGDSEPEYTPASNTSPAKIEFAHGFFASALHEISHWCIAGQQRRKLIDFGYWYAPDGRTEAQQQAFEKVEVKPQALECLFSLATWRPFRVSQDNLFAPFDTSKSTFASDVFQQANAYIQNPKVMPRDAKFLLMALLEICQ